MRKAVRIGLIGLGVAIALPLFVWASWWAVGYLSFPGGDPYSIDIRMTRTDCFGLCIPYDLRIDGNGNVHYRGGGAAAVHGEFDWTIPKLEVRKLVGKFRRANFLNGSDRDQQHLDVDHLCLSIDINGHRRRIFTPFPDAPASLKRLAEAIDSATGARALVDQKPPLTGAERHAIAARVSAPPRVGPPPPERAALIKQIEELNAKGAEIKPGSAPPVLQWYEAANSAYWC